MLQKHFLNIFLLSKNNKWPQDMQRRYHWWTAFANERSSWCAFGKSTYAQFAQGTFGKVALKIGNTAMVERARRARAGSDRRVCSVQYAANQMFAWINCNKLINTWKPWTTSILIYTAARQLSASTNKSILQLDCHFKFNFFRLKPGGIWQWVDRDRLRAFR